MTTDNYDQTALRQQTTVQSSSWPDQTIPSPAVTETPHLLILKLSGQQAPSWSLRGGADKSLARSTSHVVGRNRKCRWKEVLFMCRTASLSLLQRMKGSMSGDARYFNNIETRAVIKFFFSCKARRRRKFTPF